MDNLQILFIILVVAACGVLVCQKIKEDGIESIRGHVYKAILIAENRFQHGDNKAKFDYVISIARAALPEYLHIVVNEKMLRIIVQSWFDLVKDLLDDGRQTKNALTDR